MRTLISAVNGQATMELAVVAPFLILMMVGAIDIGRFIYDGTHVANAAHAGAQYGAQSYATIGDSAAQTGKWQSIEAAAKNDIPSSLSQAAAFTVSSSLYCTLDSNQNSPLPSCTPATPPTPPDHLDLFQKVTVQYTMPLIIKYPGLSNLTIARTVIEEVVI